VEQATTNYITIDKYFPPIGDSLDF